MIFSPLPAAESSVRRIESFLSPRALSVCGGKIEVFKTIDSTNTEAKRRFEFVHCDFAALHGSVLVAEHQSAGRGRLGKSFFSPAQSGIYLSLIYIPPCPRNCASDKTAGVFDGGLQAPPSSLFTPLAAVCVCRALDELGIEASIKWVNDVFVGGKKVCGILTEGLMGTHKAELSAVVAGVGINLYEADSGFPEELRGTAGSLPDGSSIDKDALTASLLSHMIDAFSGTIDYRLLMEEYKERSFILGKTVTVISPLETYEAEAVDISGEGHLIVRDASGGLRELISGEISLRL
ncbi:biotin--[acetyl-CoA-carboxylase] ligase [Treponema sp. HNW]|uniref:biotin--[acetyl-CoA-carboxylase] ligase n=1 Tax=Treponema sp. HNW TaxID=3116654 RepID=UPI003D0CC176